MEKKIRTSEELSRRNFLKGALVAGAGAAAAGLVGCSSNNTGSDSGAGTASAEGSTSADAINWTNEADVVVCGCGTGGTPAAIEAADAGSSVIVIEKKDWIGGSMRRCGGGIAGAGTIVQEKLGITDDSPDKLYEYIVACGEGLVDEDIVRVYADNAGKNVNWIIEDLGGQPLEEWDFSTPEDDGMSITIKHGLNVSGTPVYFDKFKMPENEYQRCHWFKANPDDVDPGDRYYSDYSTMGDGTWDGGGGTGLWKPFQAALDDRADKIEIMTETELVKLITNADGEIIGVEAVQAGSPVYLKANKGVVLATGGFGRNEEMLLDYRSTVFEEPTEDQMRTGDSAPGECDGAGVKAALAVGAGVKTIGAGSGGVKINTDAQVIDQFGEPIPRLFASSKVIGGIYGNIYPNCGAFISAYVCFGRIAGQSVAKLEPVA